MQNLFKFLILVVLFSSCKKEFHFSKDEITETDASGNLVGNINPNDWKLKSISDLTDFEKKVLLQIPLNFETSKDTIYKNIKSCENNFNFGLVVYANPMKNSVLKFNLLSDIRYEKLYTLITDKEGNFITGSFGFYPAKISEERISALVKRDFIYHYLFITEDSCGYYGSGNVIGSKK